MILNRGYDYAYTFDPMTYQRPWGTVPDLVNVDGKWGIPENWSSMPQDSQPVMQIVLKTNYKTLSTDKRYVNVVHLPSNIDSSTLPSEVRKYLINCRRFRCRRLHRHYNSWLAGPGRWHR